MRQTSASPAADGALGDLCRAEWPRLVGSLSLYVGDPDVAEEIAQEALARLCASWSKVRAMDSPSGWLHRVALNVANDRFRRLRAERGARERLARPPGETRADDGAEAVAIRAAVAALPRRQKTALLFRYFLDLSVEDTAALMDCPTNTVKSLTRRALTNLHGVPGLSLEEAT
ncbi:MAG TPA: sigma-70 family RNA polymerase sigma factor [Actinomycetota bacterium]|nr:sigma-70 family RNA polymerase sigma factor [Actinomycetota bacterium]